MTTKEAHERHLDVFAFPDMKAALRFACEHRTFEHTGTPETVAVFREEVAHFDLFFVAVRPLPKITKFHERIAG